MIKEIPEFNGFYFVSDDGCVFNKDMKELQHPQNPRTGYCQVFLRKNKKLTSRYLHRLVAEAFIPNPDHLCEVNHIDGNKTNNTAQNLEWTTRSRNIKHAYETGLRKTTSVSAFLLSGEFVKTFRSVKEAATFCGVSYNAGISNCLTGKAETAHGYKWRYAEREEPGWLKSSPMKRNGQ